MSSPSWLAEIPKPRRWTSRPMWPPTSQEEPQCVVCGAVTGLPAAFRDHDGRWRRMWFLSESIYCSSKCKQRAYRARRKAELDKAR